MHEALRRHELVAGPLEYERLNPPWAVQVRGTRQRDALFWPEGGPPWPIVFAANLGTAKARHEQIGGFDESLSWGGEDADYAWRLRASGVLPVWVPNAVVHYRRANSCDRCTAKPSGMRGPAGSCIVGTPMSGLYHPRP